RLRADRPERPSCVAGQPARQGRAADLPGPRVHHRLPARGPGVPRGRGAARRPGQPGRTGRRERESAVRRAGLHPGVRPRAVAEQRAELGLPGRQHGPAAAGVAQLRGRVADAAGGVDARAQRRRVRHRPERPDARGTRLRPRSRHHGDGVLVRVRAGHGGPAGAGLPMRSMIKTVARTRVARRLTVVPAVVLTALAAGCGTAAPGTATSGRPTASLPLGTSVSASGATWAVLPIGVPKDSNIFWQLFVLPAGGTKWSLVTPPGVA